MPRRTPEEAEQTRQALIAAGIAHFARTGYADAALEAVIASVGVTRGALYHHFKSKHGFFEAVVDSVQQALGERIVRTAEDAGEGWAGIEAGCDAFLEAALDPAYRQIAIVDGPSVLGWQTWKRLDDRNLTRTLREGLEALRASGELQGADVQALTVALSGAMNELALWIAYDAEPRTALERARATIRALLAGGRHTPR